MMRRIGWRGLVRTAAVLPLVFLVLHGRSWARDFEAEGDRYMAACRYRLAAEAYKIAIKNDPANKRLWEKHREALEKSKGIAYYTEEAKRLMKLGYMEDASIMLREAVKLNPRDESLWHMYETCLRSNPNFVVLQSERDAWKMFEKGKERFARGRYEAALRYFRKVAAFTKDKKLQFYASSYVVKTLRKLRDFYPNAVSETEAEINAHTGGSMPLGDGPVHDTLE